MLKHDWPFAVLAALALALVLTNLGADYLWADEGDTAVFAQNVLKFGVPKSWDGRAFVDYEGRRTNDRLIMVGHPWAQYYIAAGSLAIFGRNAFAVRLPFALAGWMSIWLVYGFVRRITAARSAAFCAAALMTSSVQFLLYCRQARYYGVSMLLTVGMFWIFFKMKSIWQCLLLAFCSIVLFHCVPFAIAPYFALGLTAFFYRPWTEQRRWFLISIPIVAVFTLPWLALARTGYSHDVDRLQSITVFFGRCLQYFVECASVTPLVGVAILLLFCLARAKRGRDVRDEYLSILRGDEFAFVVAMLLTLLCYAGAIAFTKSGYGLWLVGIRYTAGIVPLVAVVAGLFIAKAAGDRAVLWLSLLLIFVFTKFAQVTPWTFAQSKFLNLGGNEIVEAHVPVTIAARYLQPEQALFVRDLFRKNRGAVGEIVDLLREQAKLEDVLIANYEYEPIYFHTGLRLGLTIARDSPVYDAARRQHLSEYCFGADHVRWIAWRPAWDLGPEDSWAQLQRDIAANGGRIERVTQIKETFWENRENIHFHRFAGDQYLFAWFPRTFAEGAPESFPPPEQLPAGAIFRVDWPTD